MTATKRIWPAAIILLVTSFFLFFYPGLGSTDEQPKVKTVAGKQFTKVDNFWVDKDFNKEGEVIEVQYNSHAYQALLSQDKEINDYLALGKNIKINIKGQNIVISEIQPIANWDSSQDQEQLPSNQSYAWAIVVILAIFFVAVIALVMLSSYHKKQRNS